MVLFFLFKSNPLRWASIWFWRNSEHDDIDQMLPEPQACANSTPHTNRRNYLFIALSHIGASFISLAPTFYAQIFTVSLLRAKCSAHAMPQVLFDGNIKPGYNYQHKTKKDCGGERDIRTQVVSNERYYLYKNERFQHIDFDKARFLFGILYTCHQSRPG